MNNITEIEDLFSNTFKIIYGLPKHILLEEKELHSKNLTSFENDISSLIDIGKRNGLKRITAAMNKKANHFNDISKVLLSKGFEQHSSRVDVIKELREIKENSLAVKTRSIEAQDLSVGVFMDLWERCMLYDENRGSTLTMEQQLLSVKSELGDGWEKSCLAFYQGDRPTGITMPHIEPGTTNEGRLFYFGMLSEERGKGQSVFYHYQSLILLKQMGAEYYIGSTHTENKRMQRVFEKNGCTVNRYSESYCISFDG